MLLSHVFLFMFFFLNIFHIHIFKTHNIVIFHVIFHVMCTYVKVDVFMLDLDVGFLADPKGIVKTFYETPDIDIFVQVRLI